MYARLRNNACKTFIASRGGIEFMGVWVEQAYGIPPEQVVGSSGATQLKFGSAIDATWLKSAPSYARLR